MTAAAITPQADLYRYGGWVPMVAGMAILGWLMRFLDEVLDVCESPHAALLLVLLWPTLATPKARLQASCLHCRHSRSRGSRPCSSRSADSAQRPNPRATTASRKLSSALSDNRMTHRLRSQHHRRSGSSSTQGTLVRFL